MICKLEHLSKQFGAFRLHNIDLEIRDGSYVVILGKSGSGKSVLLELLAGLQKADSGSISFDRKAMKVGLLFQDYALFPHMTVRQNVAFPLKMQNKSAKEKDQLVTQLAEQMEITGLLDRYPVKLSGGEKQRVALARILALQPDLLLLDEPLSALDADLRGEVRSVLRKINREGLTIVHVTHDYEEALALAQHIVVIDQGQVVQQGGPMEVFRNPRNAFVAGFTGMKNFFKARVQDATSVLIHDNTILYSSHIGKAAKEGFAMIPQEEIIISRTKPESSANNALSGSIQEVIRNHYGYELEVEAGLRFSVYITAASHERLALQRGESVCLSFKSSAVRFIEH